MNKSLNANGSIYTWGLAIAILAINLVLRIVWYNDASLWLDEAYSISEAQKSLGDIIKNSAADQNPPLYLLILHYWIKIMGISEFNTRLLSILFSSFTAAGIFMAVRKYIGISAAALSALLFTFSASHFYYANEVRAFALVSLLCIISFGLFFKLFEKQNYFTFVLLGLINTAAIYSHYIAVFIPVTQFIISLVFIKKVPAFFKGNILAGAVIALAILPWIGNVISVMPEKGVYWLASPGFKQVLGVFISYVGGKKSFLLIAALVAGLVLVSRRKFLSYLSWEIRDRFILLSLVLWMVIPVVLDFLISMKTPIFLERYLLYVSIAIYILLSHLIYLSSINKYLKHTLAIGMVGMFLLTVNVNFSKGEDWRSAVVHLKSHRTDNSTVICSAWYTNMIVCYYYDNEAFKQGSEGLKILYDRKIRFVNTLSYEEFEEFDKSDTLFLLLGHAENVDPDSTLIHSVEQDYVRVNEDCFEKICVIEYRRKEMPN